MRQLMKRWMLGTLLTMALAAPLAASCVIEQGTSGTLKMGPFIDDDDFITAQTALTIQKASVRLSKNGGNMAAASADQGSSDAGAAHDELGVYDISYNTTDSNTVGNLRFDIKITDALHVWRECVVVATASWDLTLDGQVATIEDYWGELTSNMSDVGSVGKLIADRMNILTVPKGDEYTNFTFKMFLVSGGLKATGLSPACTISKDGASFAACSNSPTEIGATGVYRITFTATEMDADEVWVTMTAATARDVDFKIRTQK